MPERQVAPRVPVVVVGGGITGLATAHYLQARHGLEAVVVEASDRVGGKIRTDELAGVPVEAGPDSFLARVPWAADLCRELGLGDELIEPATSKAFVWVRGRLRTLPPGLVLGVPTGLRQRTGQDFSIDDLLESPHVFIGSISGLEDLPPKAPLPTVSSSAAEVAPSTHSIPSSRFMVLLSRLKEPQ